MLDDSTVISRFQAGQFELCDILVDRYKEPLYSFCRKLTGSRIEADDLFQDTWVKAIRNLHRCDPEKRFINWLFTICINLYRDRYRKLSRWLKVIKSHLSSEHLDTDLAGIESPDAGPGDNALKNEQEKILRRALNSLKDSFRIPLILFYYRDFSHEEIADILAIPKGTVKSRLAAARSHLKKLVEAEEHERK